MVICLGTKTTHFGVSGLFDSSPETLAKFLQSCRSNSVTGLSFLILTTECVRQLLPKLF